MRVVFYVPGMPFDAETVREASLGGSESAGYYLAREIADLGHEVAVFTSHEAPRSGDGVTYVSMGAVTRETPLGDKFEHYARNTPHDLLVAQRLPHAFHGQFAAKVCVWQLHDLALHRTSNAILGGTWQMDAVTCVSEFHREQVKEVWNVNPSVLRVVPNGVDPALYAAPPALRIMIGGAPIGITPAPDNEDGAVRTLGVPADKFLLLYQSRPERGLGNALDVMEKAAAIGLPLHLLVCSYSNPVAHMEGMYEALYSRASRMKNVTLLGSLSKPELAALQKRCDLLFYPTEFEEVSCITAMEAMHAGLPMLSSRCAALPETCKGAGVTLVPLKDGKADLAAFDKELQALFGLVKPGEYPPQLTEMRARQLEAAKTRTWRVAAERLLDVHAEALAKRQTSPAAVLRHAIEHSDIAFAEWYLAKLDDAARKPSEVTVDAEGHKWHSIPGDPEHNGIIEKTRYELKRMYDFARDPEKYAAHYAYHQGQYYDGPGANVVGEDVTQTMRFRGVVQQIALHINKTKAKHLRVLDYGCAHGHYSIPLARMFPQCDFVGMDISGRAVEKAREWAAKAAVDNAEFHVGSQKDLEFQPIGLGDIGTFDLILAGEVLEHVWDYGELLGLLRNRLLPGGCLVITTPLGRWEHSGTVAFRSGREHLHHFELHDVEDICRGHEFNILHAPAGHDRSGFALSSYVWAVWPNPGKLLGRVDYERKLRQYAPRQTVTACLIVKNAEGTLRRCIESLVDWVDEIIIAPDTSTTDSTHRLVADISLNFPLRHISLIPGVDASKEGFAAARNNSIERANGDWILWIDADEELRSPWAMHRLLRPSEHNGYGFPQVHYSVDPEQVLTTDYPCRLFRNNIGVKFYGFVHEHPELVLGEAIPWSLVRHDMKFLHHGYFDEETRQARFRRNLPLLQKDREVYPTERPLNKFLYLRDLAQSIQFDARARGFMTSEDERKAREGIKLMEEIVELPQIKMVADAMQYYSLCVSSLGLGFDAELAMKTRHEQAPDLAASLTFNGRFHSRDFFMRCVDKFSQESIKRYEDRYL